MKRDDYRRIASWYDLLLDPFIRSLRPRGFNIFLTAEGMRVLEVGCGTGTQLAYYRQRGCRVAGIDLSDAMLRVAHARFGQPAFVCQADAVRLPFPDGVFHRVLASLVLHEMAPEVRPAVLDEMTRVLQPAGRLGIIDYHPEPERSFKGFWARQFIRGIERAAGRRHYRHYRRFIDDGGIPALVRGKGLHIEQVKRVSGGNIGLYRCRPRRRSMR